MPAHIVQIGKHKFVCGLFWQSLSRPRELRKEARELGRRIKCDLMVLRKDTGTIQAGYANTAEGVKSGVFSLGAMVSKTVALEGALYDGKQQPVPSWLGVFKLPDGKWAYFAVRDESFLPNGDFAGTREEVVDRLNSDYALGGWNAVFGDEELREIGFHNFHQKRIEDFLPRRNSGSVRVHGWWALEPVSKNKRTVIAASLAVCAGAALAAGYVIYQRHLQEDESLRERAIAATRQVLASQPPERPPHPWPGEPLPQEFLQGCVESLRDLTPGGWVLHSYECTSGTTTHAWTRGGSVVEYLLKAVPDANVELDGNTARAARSLQVKASNRDDELLPAKDVLASVTSALQKIGLSPQVTFVPPPPPPPNSVMPGKAPPPPPDWKTYRLTVVTSMLAPTVVSSALDQPGVRVQKISFNGQDWSIEGVVYAK